MVLCDHDPDKAEEENYENCSEKELQSKLDLLDQVRADISDQNDNMNLKEEERDVVAVHAKYSELLQLYKGALDKRRAEMMGSCPDIYRFVLS